jgi:hypothetical protein
MLNRRNITQKPAVTHRRCSFVPEYHLFLRLLAERMYTAKLTTGQIRDAADFHAWLIELSEVAERSASLEEFFERI